MNRSGLVGTNRRPLRRERYAAKAAATVNAARPKGIATRRSRSGWVITSPKLRSGVRVSQPNSTGTIVSGTSRRRRSRRIHDQLVATVVRTTALVRAGSIRGIDDVLDCLALRLDRLDQILQHG